MLKGFLTKEKIISLILGAVAFIIVATLNTVIGNEMQAFLFWIWTQLLTSIKTYPFVWLVTSLAVAGSLGLALHWWIQSRSLNTALGTATAVVNLDKVLLQLLANLLITQNVEQERNKILSELLQETIKTLPHNNHNLYRGAILLPDGNGYLTMQANYNMSERSVRESKFYIGADVNLQKERGIAGNVYQQMKICVGHIVKRDDKWVCDHDDFKQFNTGPLHPEYYSLINVPIIGFPPTERLGVICMDSNNVKVFDLPETQELLIVLGRRVAATLTIYEQVILHVQTKP